MREDIGWHTGKGVFKELRWGVAGYAMTLPILGVGILCTLVLMFIQTVLLSTGDVDVFSGTSGGAHPIIVEIARGDWQVRVLLFALAAIAAPIVEETMFRGVLYRHLRTLSKRFSQAISIFGSVMITSFIFAAIHPQGWVAIPALMGIAVGMNAMRELRGTVLPSMIVHGVSNGLVTTMLLVFLS